MTQDVGCLPSKHEVLSSNFSTAKKNFKPNQNKQYNNRKNNLGKKLVIETLCREHCRKRKELFQRS
jgi:hypothetical protein